MTNPPLPISTPPSPPTAPKIEWAKSLAQRLNKDGAILITIDWEKGQAAFASWGKDKQLCADTGRRANIALDAILESMRDTPFVKVEATE